MILFFALLSLMALAGGLTLAFMLAAPAARSAAVREMRPYALPMGAAIAAVATLGSLYMSEAAGFEPCLLCWVQRGFMYPLALLLIAASLFRPARWAAWAAPLALGLSSLGALTAVYHYGEQLGWWGGSEQFCAASAPCTFIWIQQFGFMSIPFMAFTGFLAIALLAGLSMLGRPPAVRRPT